MDVLRNISIIVVCIIFYVLGSEENLPILQNVRNTVLFRVSDNPEPFSLVCRTTKQIPGVIFIWHKDGKLFNILRSDVIQRMGEGSLIFITPTLQDEGLYQCSAFSIYGTATRYINARRTYMDIPKTGRNGHSLVEGKPYQFNCSIPNGYPEPRINWIIQSENNHKIWKRILDQRITKSPDGSLCFTNLIRKDFDKNQRYVCQAMSPALDKPVVISEHFAENFQKHICPMKTKLVKQYVSENMTVKVGDVAPLYCIYGGTPQPSIKWFKDGKEIINVGLDRVSRYNWSNGKRLIIRDVFPVDEGVYTCVANNKVDVARINNIHVTVVSPPVFKRPLLPQMTATLKDNVTISCEIQGIPPPIVTWTYNASPLKKLKKINVTEFTTGNTTVSELTVTNTKITDTGYYGCKAANDYGELYGEILLYIR